MKNIDQIMTWGIVALVIILVGVMFMSCVSSEVYYAREQARETAYLKRIEADTLARPVRNHYSPGVLLNGWVPRYNNGYDGYWYNGVYYNNSFYNRPIIRLNSNRYVVPYKKRRTKVIRHGNNNSRNRYRSTRSVHTQKRVKQRTNGKPRDVHSPRRVNINKNKKQ